MSPDRCSCGRPLPKHRRKWCETCRKRAQRAGAAVAAIDRPPVSVVAATTATLVAVGKLESLDGAAALAIARKLDAGGDTGSAVAALVRELRATMAAACADGEHEEDPVDELSAWRSERQKRAGGA